MNLYGVSPKSSLKKPTLKVPKLSLKNLQQDNQLDKT